MNRILLSLFLIVSTGMLGYAQGSGKAIDFSANSGANNHVSLGVLRQLDTASFTVEMWVNLVANTPNGTYNDAPLFCNKDWNHGQNIGLALHQEAAGKIRINWTTTGSTRVDYTAPNSTLINKGWNHLAVTFDRHDSIKLYVNGVKVGSVNIAATVGIINDTANHYPFRIAQDGTGTYASKFNGSIDEFRLWNGVRTVSQIQTNMCKKLTGANANLLAYYNMDNISGTNIPDLSSNALNGTFNNNVAGNIVTSAAAIGDTSTFTYSTTNYTGQILLLSSLTNGIFTVSNINSNPTCVHLYQVNAAPNTYSGVPSPSGNNVYYGVFMPDTATTNTDSYNTSYDYTNFANAVTFKNNINLYARSNNAASWYNVSATNTTASNLFTKNGLTTSNEYIIGNFSTTIPVIAEAVAAGHALDFAPYSGANNNANIGMLTALDTASFTVEFWADLRGNTPGSGYSDAPLFCNKNWTTGGNVGMVVFLQCNNTTQNGTVAANFKAAGGGRVDINTNFIAQDKGWTHVAATFNRQDSMKLYVNGVFLTGASIRAATGSIASYAYHLGQDGTGTYFSKSNSKMDEVRVWKGIRTQTEIRDNMCRKLTLPNANLIAYYKLDEGTGTVINDASGNGNNGTITSTNVNNNWLVSPAPIGDQSFYTYTNNFTGQTVTGTSTVNGNLNVKNILKNPNGVHVYRVDSLPIYTAGLNSLIGNSTYYGVFPAITTDSIAQYDVEYDYTNFPAAISAAATLELGVKNSNAAPVWSNGISTRNTPANKQNLANIGWRREFMLNLTPTGACVKPDSLRQVTSSLSTATVNWTTGGGASTWNVRYGTQGTAVNSCTAINGTTTKPATINGLSGGYYDVYVQDSCNTSSSEWVGPLRINVLPCLPPDSFKVINITNDSALVSWLSNGGTYYTIEYGISGFRQGTGISYRDTFPPFSLVGLLAHTRYDVYIKTACGTSSSSIIGPITFKTDSLPTVGINQVNIDANVTVYPNPTHDGNIRIAADAAIQNVRIYNLVGDLVLEQKEINGLNTRINFGTASKGIYLLTIETVTGKAFRKVTLE